MKIQNKNSWFSIIEVLIAIFIFAMAMASIFMVISWSINANKLSKDQIIASNLAREQIEIIRNLRDNNYANLRKWNYIPNSSNDYSKIFASWIYKIENDFSDPTYNYKLEIWTITPSWNDKKDFKDWKLNEYNLCIKKDSNLYSYDCNNDDKKTRIYKYLKIEKLKDSSGNIISWALKLTSKVIWYSKWVHSFEIKTILADFNRY